MKKKFLSIMMSLVLFTALFLQSVSASDSMQEAYNRILNQYISERGGEYIYYTLFDIDNNGSKELIVDFGGSDGSRAYGLNNGIVEEYGYCAGNVKGYYQKNNNLYALCCALQQVETHYVTYEMWIDKIVLNNNKISYQTIYRNPSYRKSMNEVDQSTEKSIPEVAEFLNGAKEIDFLNIRDQSLLEEVSQIKVVINGKELSFDQPPIMENDRVMVPIRTIFEALGYTVDWYGDTQTAIAHKENNTITVQINNPEISYNRGTYSFDVSPKIVSGRTLVSVRAISECAGCNVDWNGQTKTVVITSNEKQEDAIYSTKIVSINANSLDDWKEKVEYEERCLMGISTTAYNSDGSYRYNGYIITDREVLGYTEIEVKVPYVQGIGLESEYKTVKIQIPSEIKYTLHKHKVENKMDDSFWGSLMAGLVEQNLVWTQSCECGYKNQLTWVIPIDDFKQYTGEDLYVQTVTTIN